MARLVLGSSNSLDPAKADAGKPELNVCWAGTTEHTTLPTMLVAIARNLLAVVSNGAYYHELTGGKS